jgi:sterol desaturase/sphingolipid hydroxylase (fatty acid hydroxylase superfamily)
MALRSRLGPEAARLPRSTNKEHAMGIGTILLIILVLLLIGALPAWPYSSGWGYWPSGGLGLIVLIVVLLVVLGRI